MNRRQFTTAGLALSAAGYFTGLAAARSRLANEQLQLGVIGVGNYGATNLAAVKGEKITALCDVDSRYLSEVAPRYAAARQYRDLREMLAREDLDAVVISAPDHAHAYAALAAMQRGRHVYCEKPLAVTIAELGRLIEVAADKKCITQVGMQHHVASGTQRAVAILKAGLLGDITEIHAWTNRPLWPQGVDRPRERPAIPKTLDWDLWLGPAPERPYHDAYHPLRWRGWYDFGSGALGDFGPHLLDAVFAADTLPPITTVSAETSPLHEESFPAWSMVRFEFVTPTGRPPLKLTWYDGGKQPPAKTIGVERPPPSGVMVLGSRANLYIPEHGEMPKLLPKKPDDRPDISKLAPSTAPRDLHADWLAAIKTGGKSCLPFSSARGIMELGLLGNLAIRTGKQLSWDHRARKIMNNTAAAKLMTRNYRAGWELP